MVDSTGAAGAASASTAQASTDHSIRAAKLAKDVQEAEGEAVLNLLNTAVSTPQGSPGGLINVEV